MARADDDHLARLAAMAHEQQAAWAFDPADHAAVRWAYAEVKRLLPVESFVLGMWAGVNAPDAAGNPVLAALREALRPLIAACGLLPADPLIQPAPPPWAGKGCDPEGVDSCP